jgi:hypothetical protein
MCLGSSAEAGRIPALASLAALLGILALTVAGCGTPTYESSTHDAQRLVPELSDLPPGFNLDPAESFPVPTSKILAEPFSASSSAIIRRERLTGYQAAFTSPLGHPIECTAAVYRSSAAARKVYRLRTQSVAAFVADRGGNSLRVGKIGEETYASRFDLGPASYQGVAWRFRDVLSTCIAGGSTTTSPMAEILVVARAQQRRIANDGR